MRILAIFFLSLGVLLIIFGISIFTPFLSWAGKRFNSSNSSSVNYKQPSSIRLTNMFMGICFFLFGLFITIASGLLLNTWNISNNQDSSLLKSTPQSVLSVPEKFQNPIIPGKKPSTNIRYKNELFTSQYKFDCPANIDGLNMRKQAGLNTQVINLIPCNAVGIQDKKQRYYKNGVEWYLVEYQKNIGWVAGKYLKKQANNPKNTIKTSKLVAKKRL